MNPEDIFSRFFPVKNAQQVKKPTNGDFRISLLSCAVRAPSPLNSQPWKVALRERERIVLSIDYSRVSAALDPFGRQAFLSCGTFLENLDIAARAYGYRADIDLFPAGWPDPKKPLNDPVAYIDLEKDARVQPDLLFDAIFLRHTNRRPYADKTVPLSVAGELAASGDCELVPFGFSSDRDLIREVRDIVGEAFALEISDPARLLETLRFLRFTDREVARARDGYGPAQSGRGIVSRLILSMFRPSKKEILHMQSQFVRREVAWLRLLMEKCGGIGWLSTKGDFRIDQVRAGRAFQRIHLKATTLSLALQPVMYPLADYAEMIDLRARLSELLGLPPTHTLQVFFRCGYAGTAPFPPKRDIHDLLVR